MQYWAINIFIAIYLVQAWAWDLPRESNARRVIKFLRKGIIWLGIWHSWRMFAPRPILMDSQAHIEVVSTSGQVERVENDLLTAGPVISFLNMRELKFHENLRKKDFKVQCRLMCIYILRHHNSSTENIIEANLIQVRQNIGKFCQKTNQSEERVILYSYRV